MTLNNFLLQLPNQIALNDLCMPNHGCILQKVHIIVPWLNISRSWKILLILPLEYRCNCQEKLYILFYKHKRFKNIEAENNKKREN